MSTVGACFGCFLVWGERFELYLGIRVIPLCPGAPLPLCQGRRDRHVGDPHQRTYIYNIYIFTSVFLSSLFVLMYGYRNKKNLLRFSVTLTQRLKSRLAGKRERGNVMYPASLIIMNSTAHFYQ